MYSITLFFLGGSGGFPGSRLLPLLLPLLPLLPLLLPLKEVRREVGVGTKDAGCCGCCRDSDWTAAAVAGDRAEWTGDWC